MCLYTINNLALWCGFEITDLLTWLAQSQDLEPKDDYYKRRALKKCTLRINLYYSSKL